METNLQFIQKLQTIQGNKTLELVEREKCKRDPWYWLSNWVFTLDVHDQLIPIKRFPCQGYLEALTILWGGLKVWNKTQLTLLLLKFFDKFKTEEIIEHWKPLLIIPKSRQMKITWLFVSLYLWETQFFRGKLTFFQSKKEEDANELIKRAKFIYDHQPPFLKTDYCNPTASGGDIYRKLEFPSLNSEIRGIPQGGDQLRSYTASGIFSDEMAFQEEAEESYLASKPTIDGGGRFTAVSSAAPGFFQILCNDSFKQ